MKILPLDFNGVIPDLSHDFEILPKGEDGEPQAVIMWNDITPFAKELCRRARESNVMTFIMQHGINIYDVTDYSKHPFSGDYYLAWSEDYKRQLMRDGLEENRIEVIGSTIMRYKREHNSDRKTVVFAPPHYEGDKDDAILEDSLIIWETLRGIKEISPVLKTLTEVDHSKFEGEKVVTNRDDGSDHLRKTFKLLSKAAAVVVLEEGTFSMLACAMDVPVIKIKNDKKNTDACLLSFIEDLEHNIRKCIDDPLFNRKERKLLSNKHLPDFDNVSYRNMVNRIKSELMVAA
jgi:hypothetical protein